MAQARQAIELTIEPESSEIDFKPKPSVKAAAENNMCAWRACALGPRGLRDIIANILNALNAWLAGA